MHRCLANGSEGMLTSRVVKKERLASFMSDSRPFPSHQFSHSAPALPQGAVAQISGDERDSLPAIHVL